MPSQETSHVEAKGAIQEGAPRFSLAGGIRDPEFSYFGDPEFDLGVAIAHFALAGATAGTAESFLAGYDHSLSAIGGQPSLDGPRLARYTAVEVMRRLIGVAQLPLQAPEGRRSQLLSASRDAMHCGQVDPLFEA